jgi:hypothetical protein
LKTILPLSEELNDILGMIFERNPENRITVGQLKRRIFECSHFTGPTQTLSIQQCNTPPQSPVYSGPYDAPSPASSCSDSDSVFSDAGLTDSASSSDEEDFDCDSDSGSDSAMDQDQEPRFEVVEPQVETTKSPSPVTPREKKPTVPYSRPTVSFPQQYVLPQESQYPVPVPTKQNLYQGWAPYPQHHFERLPAVPQVYQPCYSPPPQHYYPFYLSHSQFASPGGWY